MIQIDKFGIIVPTKSKHKGTKKFGLSNDHSYPIRFYQLTCLQLYYVVQKALENLLTHTNFWPKQGLTFKRQQQHFPSFNLIRLCKRSANTWHLLPPLPPHFS